MLAEADRRWLADHADALDADAALACNVVPLLARSGLLARGVPQALGGDGGSGWDAVEGVASLAETSLTAAFVLWGQRVFIEYLVQSPNTGLRDRTLPGLLAGTVSGATGLSNAMKYLGGIESLGIRATPQGAGWRLQGRVPWCTNLRPDAFIAAVAIAREGGSALVAALPSGRPGLQRSPDLDLIALRGSNTAALQVDDVQLAEDDLLHDDAHRFLPAVRPFFLGLQCGLSIGLARAALATVTQRAGDGRNVLADRVEAQQAALAQASQALRDGLADQRFLADPAALFRIRLDLADCVQHALQLELQAGGGRCYHRDQPLGFARRWRESAFIPIVTPSVTQLQGELARRAAATA